MKKFQYLAIATVINFATISCTKYNKKIAIVHYRVGRTDGVSLEIDKRKQILTNLGHKVKLISGPLQYNADFIIDELEFERADILSIKENSFSFFRRSDLQAEEIITKTKSIAKEIERKFIKYHQEEQFDLILIHNIFSVGLHLPAAYAFKKIAGKLDIPIITTHHDYYWERKEFQHPTSKKISDFLYNHLPPQNNNIVHVCINSLAQKELAKRRNINASVFPDIFDFEQKQWKQDKYNCDLLDSIGLKPNDIFILQATRIVERKGIELAIQFVKELEKQKQRLIGRRLYNGKIMQKDSNIVLVLPGFAEQFSLPYLNRLKKEIKRAGIKAKFIHKIVNSERCNTDKKIYSLWDTYVFADLITFPSLAEGWGNQFIEAIFAKKPVVLFEYPVFQADIKKEEYSTISLGNKIEEYNDLGSPIISKRQMKNTVNHAITTLLSPQTNLLLERNFNIGSHYHGKNSLKKFLKNQLHQFFYRKRFCYTHNKEFLCTKKLIK